MKKQTYEIGKVYKIDKVPGDIRIQMERMNCSYAMLKTRADAKDGRAETGWLLADNTCLFSDGFPESLKDTWEEEMVYIPGHVYRFDLVPDDVKKRMKKEGIASIQFRDSDEKCSTWWLENNPLDFGHYHYFEAKPVKAVNVTMNKDESNYVKAAENPHITESKDVKLGIKVKAWDYDKSRFCKGVLIAKRIKSGTTIFCWERNESYSFIPPKNDDIIFVTASENDKRFLFTKDILIESEDFSNLPLGTKVLVDGKEWITYSLCSTKGEYLVHTTNGIETRIRSTEIQKVLSLPEQKNEPCEPKPQELLHYQLQKGEISLEEYLKELNEQKDSDKEFIETILKWLSDSRRKNILINMQDAIISASAKHSPDSVKDKEFEVTKPEPLIYEKGKSYFYAQLPGDIKGKIINGNLEVRAVTFDGHGIRNNIKTSIWRGNSGKIYTGKEVLSDEIFPISPEEFSRAKEFIQTGEIKGKENPLADKEPGSILDPDHFKWVKFASLRQQNINEIFDHLALKCMWNSRWSGEVREFLQEAAKEFDYKTPDQR